MSKRRFLLFIHFLLAMAVVPCGVEQSRAQSDAAVEKSDGAATGRLTERVERVRERRKARVTQAQREAAAARAKAARAKATSGKDGRGDAK